MKEDDVVLECGRHEGITLFVVLKIRGSGECG